MQSDHEELDAEQLVELLSVLADGSRLAVLALLTRRAHYVEELAEASGLRPATVSHHLRRLRAAGLVDLQKRGIYRLYQLRGERLVTLARHLESGKLLRRTLGVPSEAELSARTLHRFLDSDGRLRELPRMARSRSAVLRHIAADFELGRLYPERELRHILLRFSDTTDLLLSALEEEGWIQRSGTVYRRLERKELS
jgi:DNA-binding transcriptional ArsR family regulator